MLNVHTGTQKYSSSWTIYSTRTIQGGLGADVTYSADNFVRLDPGFEVKKHSMFIANNDGCPE